ncbi:hypothetical protein ACMZOO_09265 [Catenovulum sp. SX2]|uniref:hypothetical protein n=1 Tax=Catenovulum sp. SX2 TaxID=3398614 RepID=UPI003F8362BA
MRWQALLFVVFAPITFVSASAAKKPENLVPCWFNQPVTQQVEGFIGVARPFGISKNAPKLSSRKKALQQLADHYEWQLQKEDLKDLLAETKMLSNGRTIMFSEGYRDNNGYYSYVVQVNTTNKQQNQDYMASQCLISYCDLSTCQPSWLCKDKQNTVWGASQLTIDSSKQLEHAQKNAFEIIQYLQASNVESDERVVQSHGKLSSFRLTNTNNSVDKLGQGSKLLNTHVCRSSNYLFARYTHSGESDNINKDFEEWLMQPNLGEISGTVGIFSGWSADGRLSRAIQSSIKNGLLELAKIKQISIDSEFDLHIEKGIYSLSKTRQSTSTVVTAQLKDIRVVEEKDKLIIYTWLIEQNL